MGEGFLKDSMGEMLRSLTGLFGIGLRCLTGLLERESF